MNVLRLTNSIANDPDKIYKVLESIGTQNISFNQAHNSFRFSRDYGCNPSACVLDCETLYYTCFSTASHGTLYSLVMEHKHLSFPKCLEYVCRVLGFDTNEFNVDVKLPFGGFWKNIQRSEYEPESAITTYPDDTLDEFEHCSNIMFIKDGIDPLTQEKFNVGYDYESNRITIPEYSFDGKLIGVMGRSADPFCAHEARWLPIIPAQRSLTLYGYHMNYSDIIQKGTVIIGESEKFVQQVHSFGSHIALATCGCHISTTQAKYIKALMPKRIIVAYDEGLAEDDVRAECSKLLTNNPILKTSVGYVLDKDGEIIPAGSKMNIADVGKAKYKYGLERKVIWL